MLFLAVSIAFLTASGTPLALPNPTPTLPLPSPTATIALKLRILPPFTVFETGLISITFSLKLLFCSAFLLLRLSISYPPAVKTLDRLHELHLLVRQHVHDIYSRLY